MFCLYFVGIGRNGEEIMNWKTSVRVGLHLCPITSPTTNPTYEVAQLSEPDNPVRVGQVKSENRTRIGKRSLEREGRPEEHIFGILLPRRGNSDLEENSRVLGRRLELGGEGDERKTRFLSESPWFFWFYHEYFYFILLFLF